MMCTEETAEEIAGKLLSVENANKETEVEVS